MKKSVAGLIVLSIILMLAMANSFTMAEEEEVTYLYVSFENDALWAYDGEGWVKAPIAHAPALALTAHKGNIYGAFEDGVYYYDGSEWEL